MVSDAGEGAAETGRDGRPRRREQQLRPRYVQEDLPIPGHCQRCSTKQIIKQVQCILASYIHQSNEIILGSTEWFKMLR